jgi:ribosomal protein S18 acetylase RimI-like enzyme
MDRELASMESAYEDIFRSAEGAPGFALHRDERLVRIESPIPSPAFNAVLSSRLAPDEMDEAIAATVRAYRDRPVLWRLGPATTHRERLAERLAAAGFSPAPPSTAIVGRIPAFVTLWDRLPLSVRGVRVASVEDYRRWFSVFAAGFGVPEALLPSFEAAAVARGFAEDAPLQNFLLEQGGAPIASVTTLWRPDQPFASVFNFAVRPDGRQRGYGRHALALAALGLYRQGCRAIGQFSTASAVGFYLHVARARTLGVFDNYVRLGVAP